MKSGLVTLAGRPNVGKSTLFNRLLGKKISIVSRHPATTRLRLLGVTTSQRGQIVFVDTPGFELPRYQLGQHMKKTVINALQEADLVLMVITVSGWKKEDEEALEEIRKLSKKAFLIINKIDLLPRRELLLSLIDESRHRYNFDEIYPCSALKEKSWERLREKIFDFLPEGPVLFPEEETTGNLPREYLLAEVLREKVLAETYQEVPQSVAVEIEEVSPGRNNPGVLLVQASIIVDREQLRPIIIGRGGSKLKSIGKKAREEMEQMLGQPVYLQTRVKVIPRWRDRPDIFRRFGYGEG